MRFGTITDIDMGKNTVSHQHHYIEFFDSGDRWERDQSEFSFWKGSEVEFTVSPSSYYSMGLEWIAI